MQPRRLQWAPLWCDGLGSVCISVSVSVVSVYFCLARSNKYSVPENPQRSFSGPPSVCSAALNTMSVSSQNLKIWQELCMFSVLFYLFLYFHWNFVLDVIFLGTGDICKFVCPLGAASALEPGGDIAQDAKLSNGGTVIWSPDFYRFKKCLYHLPL